MEEDFAYGLTASAVGVYFPKSFDVCVVGSGYLVGTQGALGTLTEHTFEKQS